MSEPLQLSIIIPTLNEAENITKLVTYLYKHGNTHIHEIIVVDWWSIDNTVILAQQAWAIVINSSPGRSKQMNIWASHASWTILWFVHADVLPPIGFAYDIDEQYNDSYTAW